MIARMPAWQLASTIALSVTCLWAAPAYAAAADGKDAGTNQPDEKLPAQLPSVTIQGTDLSNVGDHGTKVAPVNPAGASRVRLPEPDQRRATRENNKALMVTVTPSTLEAPPALPGTKLPYTSLLGGYGPVTEYRLGLYDARLWGPVLGITDLGGHGGWDWSGWRAVEDLDMDGLGRADLRASGFGWNKPSTPGAVNNTGGQTYFSGVLEHEVGTEWSGGLSLDRGSSLTQHAGVAAGDLETVTGRGSVHWRPTSDNDHQPQLDAIGQYRQWGVQTGPEGYVDATDFWSLSDQIQLEGALGGGFWGRGPIVDPSIAFHYRPSGATHLYASLKTASELPDFSELYLERAATGVNPDLQTERVEGWAQLGGSHRLSEALWGSLDLGFRRSFNHIYWADLNRQGLWTPMNASGEQWSPTATARLQIQVASSTTLDLGYSGNAVYPLGSLDQKVMLGLNSTQLEQKLDISVGVDGRLASLSTLQLPGGGSASGAFAKAEVTYKITPDWMLGIHATDVPLWLDTTGSTYFAPAQWMTVDARYQF